jgi:hypothetical protein
VKAFKKAHVEVSTTFEMAGAMGGPPPAMVQSNTVEIKATDDYCLYLQNGMPLLSWSVYRDPAELARMKVGDVLHTHPLTNERFVVADISNGTISLRGELSAQRTTLVFDLATGLIRRTMSEKSLGAAAETKTTTIRFE